MAGLRPVVSGIGIVVLFSIALFSFMFSYLGENNPTHPIITYPYANSTLNTLHNSGDQLVSAGNTIQSLIQNAEPSPVFIFLIFKAAFDIPLAFLTFAIQGSAGLVTFLFTTLFSSGQGTGSGSSYSIVFGIISAILVIAIVIVVVRAVRTGETER